MNVDIAILCPKEVEFENIRKILSNPESFTIAEGLPIEFGYVQGKNALWKIAVVGPDFLAISFEMKTHHVIKSLKPTYIILAGMAGGIKDAGIGDIVVGTKAYDYEQGKETPEGFAARPNSITNNSVLLLNLCQKITREIQVERNQKAEKTEFYFGPIASGNKVIASTSSEAYKKIKNHYNDTLAVEMEALAFAKAASNAKIPYLNIRGISDLIDGKKKADDTGSQGRASIVVADFLKQLIYDLPASIVEAREGEKAAQKFKVCFSEQPLSGYFRTLGEAELLFEKDTCFLVFKSNQIVIENVEAVEHYKMPGDIRKNWVKITFKEQGISRMIYLSASKYGLGAWIGGSKKLAEQFRHFFKINA